MEEREREREREYIVYFILGRNMVCVTIRIFNVSMQASC